jgi:threonine/homoserine/homoserine lactone efflux protein
MEIIVDFYAFLVSAILLSLSGVMAPGPMFAVTIAKSLKDKKAGVLISIGHGVVEFPIMFLIYFLTYFSLSQPLASDITKRVISFLGGLFLMFLGVQLLKAGKQTDNRTSFLKYGSLFAGVLATGGNPYFLLWWAVVGAGLIMNAAIFGIVGFLVFAIVHWLCDFSWNTFVSITVFKSQRFWSRKAYTAIWGFCIAVFIGFGLWSVFSAVL